MTIFLRKNRHVFKVHGPDAKKLLSDVFTCHIPQNQNDANWWALLSPQGKIQAEGLIGLNHNAFWLDIATEIAPRFSRRMGMYQLRANALIEDLGDNFKVGWASKAYDKDDFFVHRDQRHTKMGYRIIAPGAQTKNWERDKKKPEMQRVKLGISELGADFQADTLFPHDIGMDLLKGIDFAKGCYVGQEVVSRMRHRANIRRRPIIVSIKTGKKGDEILQNQKLVGTIGSVVDGTAIGIVRIDKITDTSQLEVNNMPVKISLPDWANYDFASPSNPDR